MKKRQRLWWQLRDRIIELEELYCNYSKFANKERDVYMRFELMTKWELCERIGVFVAIVVGSLIRACCSGDFSKVPATVCVCIGAIIGIRVTETWLNRRKTEKSQDGYVYITYWFASQKHLDQVQAEIDLVKPEVEEARIVYTEREYQIARKRFAKRLAVAKELAKNFDGLFQIAKKDLNSIVLRKLSINDYGLAQDITISAEVKLNRFDNVFLQEMIPECFAFDLNAETLHQLATYITVLKAYKAEYDGVVKACSAEKILHSYSGCMPLQSLRRVN